jgi:capsular polysaccharide biosynthesis protein
VLSLTNAVATPASYDDATLTQLGAIYTSDGDLVRSAQRPWMAAWKHRDDPRFDTQTPMAETLERAVYGGRYYGHFGHFLLETVPTLYQAAPHDGVIICHPNPAVWAPEWLAARFRGYLLESLQIAPERIHLISTLTRIESLTVPALETPPISGQVGPIYIEACARVRDYALAGGTASASKIYLSRRSFVGGSNRLVENEDELEALFERRGFDIIVPEKLPIADQIRAVANADYVAGVDGSALHLCGFMQPGATVLIIETRPFKTQRAINEAIGLTTLTSAAPFVRREEDVAVYRADLADAERRLNA